ncbi:uncharacterized protein LOC113773842 [Coffea eugenioides]|uniref:uncharacterized protein LOC113773842 n=1 Tax=Coffea eugenioides TaxID=49369 RepID=UPI000F60D7EC|nr:uncharacterized protein LOC113773842 [Coffea eugenioides]
MEDIERIAVPFQYALVGKFSRGRPNMDDLRKFFHALDLTAEFSLGLLDRRHILIRLANEADYYRVWSRGVWSINKAPMRVFKWSIDFHVDREASIVPVWFALPKLPVHIFHKECLFSIVGCLGRPLCVDAATAKGSRPNVARVCVEVDLLKSLPSRVWIAFGERMGFWQPLIPKNLPKYCEHCFHQGHGVAECRIKNPGLKVSRSSQATAGTSDAPTGAATAATTQIETKVDKLKDGLVEDGEAMVGARAKRIPQGNADDLGRVEGVDTSGAEGQMSQAMVTSMENQTDRHKLSKAVGGSDPSPVEGGGDEDGCGEHG